jgi:hypothetical protein
VTRPGAKKLDDRSVPMVFLGYEEGSKAYRLFDPVANRVHVSRDVVFDEDASWNWGSSSDVDAESPFVVEYLVHGGALLPPATATGAAASTTPTSSPVPSPHHTATEDAATPSSTPSSSTPSGHAATATPTSDDAASEPRFVSPPLAAEDMFDDDDDPAEPHRFRLVSDLREKGVAVPARAERLFVIDEPTTFADAESHDCWRQAMVEELSSIEENGTWTLVDPPEGIRPIGLKWVFKAKRDATCCQAQGAAGGEGIRAARGGRL